MPMAQFYCWDSERAIDSWLSHEIASTNCFLVIYFTTRGIKLFVVVHACNFTTPEAEVRGSQVRGQPRQGLTSPCLRKTRKKQRKPKQNQNIIN